LIPRYEKKTESGLSSIPSKIKEGAKRKTMVLRGEKGGKKLKGGGLGGGEVIYFEEP